MRERSRILANLESLYREAYEAASGEGDEAGMRRLDFDFQRDQLYLEILLDLRDAFVAEEPEGADSPSLLEKAQAIRKLTRGIKSVGP